MYNESPLAQIRYRAEMKTSAAIQTVSAVMSPIGRQPTANSCLRTKPARCRLSPNCSGFPRKAPWLAGFVSGSVKASRNGGRNPTENF
jgi:hypothetical protein